MTTPIDEEKAERGGRRSPTHSLSQAIEFVATIRTKLGDGPYSRDAMAEALGHACKSGSATTKIGTLTHFGLLDRSANAYKLSELAHRILTPQTAQEKTEGIADAAKQPVLYAELVTAFAGKALPELLSNILIRTYGVAPGNAEQVAKTFRETFEYAGLLQNGILRSELLGNQVDPAIPTIQTPTEVRVSASTPPSTSAPLQSQQEVRTGKDDFAIPLTKGRKAVLTIPLPVDATDLDRIKKWIDLMSEVLIENVQE